MIDFAEAVRAAGIGLELAGVLVTMVGVVVGFALGVVDVVRRDAATAHARLRRRLGRAILLGLELLVGADIVRTVSEPPTLAGVAALGGVVLIRTFLSFALEVEIDGRWPWQRTDTQRTA